MLDYNKINDSIEQHFADTQPEKIAENLKKYDLDALAKLEERDRKNALVDLIFSSRAFEIKRDGSFSLENGGVSDRYIRLLEIVEDNRGRDLAKLMARYIDIIDDKIDRIVGILKKSDREQQTITQENYHLSSIIATVMSKRASDLVYQRLSTDKFQFWQDGKLSDYKKIVIIDEVLTTGTGVIEAVKYLREFHKEVIINDVFVYVCRATGKKLADIKERLARLDVSLYYIIDEKELIDMLRSRHYPHIDSIKSTQ